MNDRIAALRQAWSARSPRDRAIAKAMLFVLGLAALLMFWSAIYAERARLDKALPQAQARLQRMQDDAAEIARLRGQANTASPSAPAEALTAAARSRHLDLTVISDGSDRLQVHGNAGFDDTVAWLATVQQDYKLRLASLTAARAGAGVRIDAVLVAVTPASP